MDDAEHTSPPQPAGARQPLDNRNHPLFSPHKEGFTMKIAVLGTGDGGLPCGYRPHRAAPRLP
ncbi:hypothetical protein GZL_00987 [Streptomyces sp. 769]|nr:hypothetical protein GZL_00987 [Streptomyces sp. 769]